MGGDTMSALMQSGGMMGEGMSDPTILACDMTAIPDETLIPRLEEVRRG